MNIKIKTKDIEIEYSDEYSIIQEETKRRIIEIIESSLEKQKELDDLTNGWQELDLDFKEEETEEEPHVSKHPMVEDPMWFKKAKEGKITEDFFEGYSQAVYQIRLYLSSLDKEPEGVRAYTSTMIQELNDAHKKSMRSMRYWQDPKDVFPDITSQEAKKKYKDYLTVGRLKKELEYYPDDAIVVSQRVEDIYYEKHGWETIKKDDPLYPGHKQEYTPVWSTVHYKDDDNCLFLDLHY